MGFVKGNNVKVYVSKNQRLCLKYKFINKNNQSDFMYIEILDTIIGELNQISEEFKRDREVFEIEELKEFEK